MNALYMIVLATILINSGISCLQSRRPNFSSHDYFQLQIYHLEQHIYKMEGRTKNLESNWLNLVSDNRQKEKLINDLQLKIDECKKSSITLTQDLQQLKVDVMTNDQDINALQIDVRSNVEDISNFEAEQVTQDTRIDDLEDRIETLEDLVLECPPNTKEIGDYCYTVGTMKSSYEDASNACIGLSGYLVEPPPTEPGVEALVTGLEAQFPTEFQTINMDITSQKRIWTGAMQFPVNDLDLKYPVSGLVILKEDPFLANKMDDRIEGAVIALAGTFENKLLARTLRSLHYYACQFDKIPSGSR